MGDRLGIPGAVDFYFFFSILFIIVISVFVSLAMCVQIIIGTCIRGFAACPSVCRLYPHFKKSSLTAD